MINESIILSGLNKGFKSITPDSFDPRSDEDVMDEIMSNQSFVVNTKHNGKEYILVGLKLIQDVGARTVGRDGYSFAAVEATDDLPSNIIDILIQNAVKNISSVYSDINDVTINSFKPIKNMINELTQNEKQIKTGKPENIYYGFYKGRFEVIYSAMGNPDGYFRQQLKVRNIGGNKYNFNPDFIVVSKAIYDKHPEDYIKLKPYVDKFWDRINNESVNEELIMINENESEVEYLMSKFYEYRNLAAEAVANGAKEEAADFNKQAMEYYERAMDLEVANMSNSDLSPEDQAMIDKYEDEEANREVPRDYASMYERFEKLAGLKEEYSSTDFDTYKIGDQIELDPKYFVAFEFPEGYVGTVKYINQADYADETPVYTVKLKNIDPFGDEHEDISVEYKQVK